VDFEQEDERQRRTRDGKGNEKRMTVVDENKKQQNPS
jgi:hypothetical protein